MNDTKKVPQKFAAPAKNGHVQPSFAVIWCHHPPPFFGEKLNFKKVRISHSNSGPGFKLVELDVIFVIRSATPNIHGKHIFIIKNKEKFLCGTNRTSTETLMQFQKFKFRFLFDLALGFEFDTKSRSKIGGAAGGVAALFPLICQ